MGTLTVVPMAAWVVMLVLRIGMAAPISTSQVLSDEEELKHCSSDIDCNTGYFCYMAAPDREFHYCAACINCNDYRRQAGWVGCVKSEDACGPCLPGFVKRGRHCGYPENEFELDVGRSSGSSGSHVPGVYIGVISGLATTILVLGAVITSLLYKYGALSLRRHVQVATVSTKVQDEESDFNSAETEVLTCPGPSRCLNSAPSAPPLDPPPPPYYSAMDPSDSSESEVSFPKPIARVNHIRSPCSQASVKPTSRRRTDQHNVQALPFAVGNAANRRAAEVVVQMEAGVQPEDVQEGLAIGRRAAQVAREHVESMDHESPESLDPNSTENSYMSEQSMDLSDTQMEEERSQPDGALAAPAQAVRVRDITDSNNDDDPFMELEATVMDVEIDAVYRLRFTAPPGTPSPSTSTSEDSENEQKVPDCTTLPPSDK